MSIENKIEDLRKELDTIGGVLFIGLICIAIATCSSDPVECSCSCGAGSEQPNAPEWANAPKQTRGQQ